MGNGPLQPSSTTCHVLRGQPWYILTTDKKLVEVTAAPEGLGEGWGEGMLFHWSLTGWAPALGQLAHAQA